VGSTEATIAAAGATMTASREVMRRKTFTRWLT